jgi:response regulator RpfG family c-di-GMP phosphodiesterase
VALRRLPTYRDQITPAFIRLIGISSALHDIGKVGVEDQILLKPGALSDDERLRMQLHTRLGSDCIQEIETQLGTLNFLQMAREIALYHHERWDGRGYPTGLAGEAIPLAARIVAIADVYDALSVRRVYKTAMPHQQCVDIIRREAGKQFDPALVEVFLSIADEFAEIARQFSERSAAQAAAHEEDLALRAEAEIEQTIARADNLLEDCSL